MGLYGTFVFPQKKTWSKYQFLKFSHVKYQYNTCRVRQPEVDEVTEDLWHWIHWIHEYPPK